MLKKALTSLIQNKRVRSSRLICYLVFLFYPHPKNRTTLWDSTSLVMKEALAKWVKNSERILEIGTGDVGLLSYFLANIREVDITAVDICDEFIINSAKNSKRHPNINFFKSDLYDGIRKGKKFDIIFSNPPYVKSVMINPEGHMKYHRFSQEKMLYYASDGGDDGIKVISEIIRGAGDFLEKDGSLILGFNKSHIEMESLKRVIKESEFQLYDKINSNYTSCIAINLKKVKKS
ncbi:MAG: class I SAM-dependent methyltransferase [Bacteroidales bacterium]